MKQNYFDDERKNDNGEYIGCGIALAGAILCLIALFISRMWLYNCI